jgi:hypothetical protein
MPLAVGVHWAGRLAAFAACWHGRRFSVTAVEPMEGFKAEPSESLLNGKQEEAERTGCGYSVCTCMKCSRKRSRAKEQRDNSQKGRDNDGCKRVEGYVLCIILSFMGD